VKKILIALTIVISCLGINKVSADSVEFDYSYIYLTNAGITNFNEFSSYLNKNEGKVIELYRILFEKYNAEYVNEYPYYLLQFYASHLNIIITLTGLKSPIYLKTPGDVYAETYYEDGTLLKNFDNSYVRLLAEYSFDDGMYILPVVNNDFDLPAYYGFQGSNFHETFFFDSNFDLKIYTDMDNIIIHNYRGTNSDYIINSGDVYPTLYKSGISSITSYTEINLNDYAYVALSLKDYNKSAFESIIQVKGEYCVNAVYDYGLSAKEKYDSSVTDICSPYYDNYTPVRHYVLDNDIKNHAIYYLKAHDINKENKIKVDSSIFNIHYITEEEADNPIININGRDYSILPFDELPSNSIKNTEEGNWPGASEEFSFTDIFTAPLEFLKDVWSSITSVFSLITELLSLLPPIMQNFLYASFMLAVVIGLIKIIL